MLKLKPSPRRPMLCFFIRFFFLVTKFTAFSKKEEWFYKSLTNKIYSSDKKKPKKLKPVYASACHTPNEYLLSLLNFKTTIVNHISVTNKISIILRKNNIATTYIPATKPPTFSDHQNTPLAFFYTPVPDK